MRARKKVAAWARATGRGIRQVALRTAWVIRWFLGTREGLAYVFLGLFVICTTVGAYLIYAPAGWITAGAGLGVYGYLLGRE